MSKLCIGSFIKIITGALKKGAKKHAFIGVLLKHFSSDDSYTESTKINGLINGKYNYYINIDRSETDYILYFEKTILPDLDPTLLTHIVAAIKDILNGDNVNDETIIGFNDSKYTKSNILKGNKFFLPEFLSNIFYYVGTNVNNCDYKNELKEMKGFNLQTYNDKANLIVLTKALIATPGVTTTIKSINFDKIFKEIYVGKTEFNNNAKIYALDIINNKFDYEKLEEYILSNISNYVYDRLNYDHLHRNDAESIGVKAIRKYKDKIDKDNTTNHFDEIMLYSFLECVLQAPKLFSKMELQDKSGQFETSASGIHLLTYSLDGNTLNQLVLGAASTNNNLVESLSKVFVQISKIRDNRKSTYAMLDNSIAHKEFDAQTTEFLSSIILPTDLIKKPQFDESFGVFLGYSIDTSKIHESNPYNYKNALFNKMKEDIDHLLPEINQLIKDEKLENYSLYFFVLPLNEANLDKEKIMKEALGC